MKNLNKQRCQVLVIGYGSIAKKHITFLRKIYTSITFLVIRKSKLYEHESDTNIKFIKIDDLYEYNPDFAIIASPAPTHLYYFKQISKFRIPIFIEKPLDIDNFDRSKLKDFLEYEKKNTVLIGYVLRHHDCIKWLKTNDLKRLVGKIIEVDFYSGSWLPSWRTTDYRNTVSSKKSLGGGVLLELSHEIDLGFWLFGFLNLKSAYITNTNILDVEVEDYVKLITFTKDIPIINFSLNFNTNPARRHLIIRGSEGEINCNLINNQIFLNEKLLFEKKQISSNEMFLNQTKHFINCIKTLDVPICSLRDGVLVLDLIKQARLYGEK